ncbi:hypothetical protein PCASD_02441 [Puccinia coronata f. sp. avenae]|uniref:Uncharacterized protein n=1 Tax=Puccinia coronata f. sp. avenae TaxID=200324 RepID=A0A2N5VMD9_9BASI|nr:hypothetical protein PCASD_02441 [Puccinia coronata f. sp. avenae]
MGTGDGLRPMDTILAGYTATMKICIAFLRLEVIHHYLNPNPANPLAQWDIIDQKLVSIRHKSSHYKDAFDQALFGNFHFANMDEEAIFLPTKAKIQLEIVAVAASAKERFNPNAIANLNKVATFE